MLSQRAKQDSRKSAFKATVNLEDGRRKREDAANGIRKAKKDELMAKKRNIPALKETQIQETVGSTPTEIQELFIQQVNANDTETQLEGTTAFRKILSIEKNPPIDQVIASGVVPRFVHFLTNSNHGRLRFEAAWAITNIASGNATQTEYVLRLNVVPLFVHLLSSPDDNLREQSVWALGNIAGDSPQSRNYVIDENVLPPLLVILNHSQVKPTMLRNAVWLLSNLCRGKPQPQFEKVAPSLPVLARLICHHDNEVIIDALWALSYLSDGNDNNIQAVVNAGIIPRVIQLLSNPNANMQTPALRCLGNIVTGNDQQTQACIDSGFLQSLKYLLRNTTRKNIRKEAAWAISNITAGTREQTQMVINAGIVPELVNAFTINDFDVKKEAAYAICNATSWKAFDQVNFLVDNRILQPMVELLDSRDTKVISISLECIENVLHTGEVQANKSNGVNPFCEKFEEVEGIDKLEALQEHSNEDIYQKAVNLLEKYFNAEEDGAENMAPSNNQTYSFAPQFTPQSSATHFNF